jgi:ABC-type Fe3+ transport system permease subunit
VRVQRGGRRGRDDLGDPGRAAPRPPPRPARRLVALALPVTLLLPSLTYAYGWAQFVRLAGGPIGRALVTLGVDAEWLRTLGVVIVTRAGEGPRALLDPAGPADAARCVWSLATWLWPIPAGAMAWALRRADPAVRQQALLDGAAGRVALRQVLAPALVGGLAVWVLAAQEFAVYEPTGISVVATEVRQVFETGSFSSGVNPITQPMGGGMYTGEDLPTGGGAGGGVGGLTVPPPPVLPMPSSPQDVQQRAAAAAVAVGVPMLGLTAVVGLVVAAACRRWSAASDEVHADSAETGPVVRASSFRTMPPTLTGIFAIAVLLVTLGVPIGSLLLRHQRPLDVVFVWRQSGDLVLGSLLMAALAGLAAAVLAVAGTARPPRGSLLLALASFLVGGQLLAIALIRLYNRPNLGWVYNAPPIMVMAYLGRFGWLALLAAAATWSRPWRQLRAQAAVDGAGPSAAARHVVWPLAWPLVVGAALLVLVLSLTEVPATVLAAPHRPPQIVPMLMTWVHTLESDPMIEASLLLASVVTCLSLVATGCSCSRAGPSHAPRTHGLQSVGLVPWSGCR